MRKPYDGTGWRYIRMRDVVASKVRKVLEWKEYPGFGWFLRNTRTRALYQFRDSRIRRYPDWAMME